MHPKLARGVRRAGARLILSMIFLFTLPGCRWEGSGATLTPPVTGGTAQAVTLVSQDNALAFAQVVTSALNKTLIVGKIANDATSAVAPDFCNSSDPGVAFHDCQGTTPYIPSALNFMVVPPQSSTNTVPGLVTGICDSASPNSSGASAGTYNITATYVDPAVYTPPPGVLYQVSVRNTLDVQFNNCVIRGVDMDGGFHVTNLTFDDSLFTTDRTELASGWIIFDGLVIRNVGHETSFNSWDGGTGQKYVSFTTSEMSDGAIRTEMTTGDTVLSQDQSNQNLDNILVSLDFSYTYQPATDNIVLDANGHVNIDSEILGIHKADVLVSMPAVNWYNSENAPYDGTAVYTENSIPTTTPARLLLDVLGGTGLGSIQLNLDLDGNGINDGTGSTYPWVALAGAY